MPVPTSRKAPTASLLLAVVLLSLLGATAPADEAQGPDDAFRAAIEALPSPDAGSGFGFGGEIRRTDAADVVGRYDFAAQPSRGDGDPGWRLRDQLGLGATVVSAEALVGADLSPISGTVLVAKGAGVVRTTWARTAGGFRLERAEGPTVTTETVAHEGTAVTTTTALLLLARSLETLPGRFATWLWRPSVVPHLAPVEIVVEPASGEPGGRRLVVTSPDLGLTAELAGEDRALVALRIEGLADEREAVLETRVAPAVPWMRDVEAIRALDERLDAGDPEGALAAARRLAQTAPGPVADARVGLLYHDALAAHLDDPETLRAYARAGREHLTRALAAAPEALSATGDPAAFRTLLGARSHALALVLGEAEPSAPTGGEDPGAASLAAATSALGPVGPASLAAVLDRSAGRFVAPAFDTVGVVVLLERFERAADGAVALVGTEAAGRGGLYARVHPYRLAVEPDGAGGWRAVDVVGEGASELVHDVRLDGRFASQAGTLRLSGTFADPGWTPAEGAAPGARLRWRLVGQALLVATERGGALDPPRILPAPTVPLVASRAHAALLARLASVTNESIAVLAWDPPTPERPEHWAPWRLGHVVEGWDGWGAHVILARDAPHERVEIALDLETLALVGLEHRGSGVPTERWLRLPYVPPPEEREAAGRRMIEHMEDLPAGLSQGLVLLRRGVALLGGTSAALWEALGDVQLSLSADPDRPVPARERVRLALGAADAFEVALDAPDDREGHDPVSIDYRLAQAFVRAGNADAAEAVAARIATERGAPQVASVLRTWIAQARRAP